jgi:hypothetical protein
MKSLALCFSARSGRLGRSALYKSGATYMAQWRERLPKAYRIGNMKYVEDVSRDQQDDICESFEDVP